MLKTKRKLLPCKWLRRTELGPTVISKQNAARTDTEASRIHILLACSRQRRAVRRRWRIRAAFWQLFAPSGSSYQEPSYAQGLETLALQGTGPRLPSCSRAPAPRPHSVMAPYGVLAAQRPRDKKQPAEEKRRGKRRRNRRQLSVTLSAGERCQKGSQGEHRLGGCGAQLATPPLLLCPALQGARGPPAR